MNWELVNQVYNGNFARVQEAAPDFPDGWERIGGDSSTKWKWTGSGGEPGQIIIYHPTGPRAGIRQTISVPVQAGDNQRWEVQVKLKTEPAGIPSYIRIYMGSGGQQLYTLTPSSESEKYSRVFSTGTGTNGIILEVGILGTGTLTIEEIEAYRLYPLRELRLDERGQTYVRHVESIGQIQRPVSVRLTGPLPTIPVSVDVSVTNDIRNLTPVRDGIRIYGSSGTPVSTTSEGLTQVQLTGRKYQGITENVIAAGTPEVTLIKDISELSVYSFAVYNAGTGSAFVRLEISPDGNIWLPESIDQEVSAGSIKTFVPQVFLRYTRLAYTAISPTPLTVWFQAQI
ncbi:MAG: DUF6385 domain-containing protein [Desulfitobacterium hafniense]|nr:DUF6385 domain-containing protein [Desulfitobacterium hafniense]